MPIYEYLCDDCGERYERLVMNKFTVVTCPKCESTRKTVQLSVFAAPASSNGKSSEGASAKPFAGGGCCGGSCGCH
ncbi:MAG TPA: zinc ribbon domain-containing protein [Candidatus Acidoferrales bacterium]|nr:zinc ribbon domain-containing protein [Candidatus Acidoferrales bacterium]